MPREIEIKVGWINTPGLKASKRVFQIHTSFVHNEFIYINIYRENIYTTPISSLIGPTGPN
jgi:hypothetical protein